LEDPLQRKPASVAAAVSQAMLTADQAWQELANAVVSSGTGSDLANRSVQESKLTSPSAVPVSGFEHENVELRAHTERKGKEFIEVPTNTSEENRSDAKL